MFRKRLFAELGFLSIWNHIPWKVNLNFTYSFGPAKLSTGWPQLCPTNNKVIPSLISVTPNLVCLVISGCTGRMTQIGGRIKINMYSNHIYYCNHLPPLSIYRSSLPFSLSAWLPRWHSSSLTGRTVLTRTRRPVSGQLFHSACRCRLRIHWDLMLHRKNWRFHVWWIDVWSNMNTTFDSVICPLDT